MKQPHRHTRFFHIIATIVIMLLLSYRSYAQQDIITYNSTCTNYKIQFNASLFETVLFPDKVTWNFGDPASGYYNTVGTMFPTHSYASPGTYLVTLTVVNAGDTTVLQDSIRIINPIAYNFGPDIFLCETGDTILTAPSIPGAVYEWNDDSATTTPALRVNKTGVYTVKINGCAVTDSVGVFFSQQPMIDLGEDHVLCTGESLRLNAASQNGTYTWKLNGAVLPDTTAQLAVTPPGGQYIAIVSVPGCGVFADTANITFNALAAPSFSLGPDTLLCPKQVYPLTASAAGATAYNWSTGATTQSIQVKTEGLYWAFVKINNQCEVTDTVEITYRGDKNLNFNDTAICKGSTLILNADFGTGVYNWVADPPQRNDQNQTGQSTYYVYQPGLYKVTATVGNCVYTDSLHVSFNDSLLVDIGRDTSLCIGEAYMLHVKTNANSFLWQDGSASVDYPVSSPGGTYSLIAQNGCGADTVSVKIDFRTCSCELTLPNAFTPNGDGHNETFRPLHPCNMSNYMIRIFDRYGELVFQSADPGAGWDGMFRGARAVPGTYVWMASYINDDTKQKRFRKGFVVLIR